MYWTDWGDVARIERVSMDGAHSTRQVLHKLVHCIPYYSGKFCWVYFHYGEPQNEKLTHGNLDIRIVAADSKLL